MRGVEHHRRARSAHDGQRAHIGHQIVVAKDTPRSHARKRFSSKSAARAAARALSITFFISYGDRNWPFLMLTDLPERAQAWMKSVCRHRKAGVCKTSTTAAARATSCSVCTSVSTGTPTRLRTSARISSPASMPQPRNDWLELRFALSYEALKMNG